MAALAVCMVKMSAPAAVRVRITFTPRWGGGISYLLKPETGIVVRAEVAKGSGDNSALYLRFGHPF